MHPVWISCSYGGARVLHTAQGDKLGKTHEEIGKVHTRCAVPLARGVLRSCFKTPVRGSGKKHLYIIKFK